jgi:prepilin-type N-terminal cleavage/methylation domain-containing protein
MGARHSDTNDHECDSGFTLVELLISSALAVLILTIAGGLLLSGLRTQETATSVTDATTSAQQIARSVQSGVRNATALSMTADGAGSELLLARVLDSGNDSTAAHCQAWYYTTENGGTVYTTTSSAAIGAPSSGWTLLGSGVSPSADGGPVFLAPSNSRVELTFKVAAAAHPYVLINTTTYTQQSTTVSAPCF